MPSYGRGGAGNIQAIEQINIKISEDLEANQNAADFHTTEPLQPIDPDREEQQYAHTGRGGAGNYYNPRDLKQNGNFEDVQPSKSGSKKSAPGAGIEQPIKTLGRGGAGNYTFGMSEGEVRAARKRIEEEAKRVKLKRDIEKGVEGNLAMPQKAKLPGSEPF